ncbi:ATP-binding cassette sub- A member 2 [Ranunculus cassubicifolius]
MDPITRRHVWDIIDTAKKGRAIVLTTHSMEEADILGDRIAIMAKGRLRCIGTSIRLKSRFGTGFIANVSFTGNTPGQTPDLNNAHVTAASSNRSHDSVKHFFKQHLNVEPKEETKPFLTFVIPHEKGGLLTKEFSISNIQLGLITFEEVFLNIAKKAELDDDGCALHSWD